MVLRLAAAVLFLCLSALASIAQEARVVIPDAPSGAFISGCYRADRALYGPYALTFCVDRGKRGSYSVQGPRLRCDGRLTWKSEDRGLTVSLRRQSCNLGKAWAAAEIQCRPQSLLSAILNEILRDLARNGEDKSRVVVPDRPTIGRLNCRYFPTVAGVSDRQFFANRSLVEPR